MHPNKFNLFHPKKKIWFFRNLRKYIAQCGFSQDGLMRVKRGGMWDLGNHRLTNFSGRFLITCEYIDHVYSYEYIFSLGKKVDTLEESIRKYYRKFLSKNEVKRLIEEL